MEVVAEPPRDLPQAVLEKAAGEGRIRGTALEVLGRVRERPRQARTVLSRALRDARHLHSRERRLVGDGVRAVLRDEALTDARTGRADDRTRWVAWLVSGGLSAAAASAEAPGVDWAALPSEEAVLDGLDPVERVARLGTLDPWLAGELVDSLGAEGAEGFLRQSATRAPVGLRVQGTDVDTVRRSLERDGVVTRPMRFASRGLEVEGRANLQATTAWKRGWIEVQDEGSQLVAEAVAPDGGALVDLCAGAGGKTLALAALAPGARILAMDVRDRALKECRRRARKAGVTGVQVERLASDGSLPASVEGWRGTASRVLVDAPCSGTGTLRRHPELRLRWTEDEVRQVGQVQREVLARGATLVAPGGWLVYATCSVLRAENEAVVDAFLEAHPGFGRRSVPLEVADGRDLRLAPHTHGTDGFYAAVLVREG